MAQTKSETMTANWADPEWRTMMAVVQSHPKAIESALHERQTKACKAVQHRAERLQKPVRRIDNKRKLTDDQAYEIIQRNLSGEKQADIGRDYGITQGTVSALVNGRTYRNLKGTQ